MSARAARPGTVTLAAGAVCLATIVGLAAPRQSPPGSDGWMIPSDAASIASAVAPSPVVIAKGKALFQSRCARCHGQDGAGPGPEADPRHPPTDLTDSRRALLNPDGVLFYKIWNGRARPRMPAMKSEMSANDAWMIVQYVKTLRGKG